MMNGLAGYLAAFFMRPTDSVPLNIVDHGDPVPLQQFSTAPTMFRTPIGVSAFMAGQLPAGAYQMAPNGEGRVDPAENKRVLGEIADLTWWKAIERRVTG